MRSACPWHLHNSPLANQGASFGPLAALAPALPYISAGMTVLGGIMGASAASQQGDAAYRNAVMRNQQAEQQAQLYEMQARQQRVQAGQEQAAAQRKAIEAKRKGDILASRARAVMAASGGGVDEKLVSSLIGEGEYGKDVALYEGNERARGLNNAAEMSEYQADAARWSGKAGVAMGAADRDAYKNKATWTLLGSVANAGVGLAGKYGPSTGAKYDINQDILRTAGDADLGGYGGGYGGVV